MNHDTVHAILMLQIRITQTYFWFTHNYKYLIQVSNYFLLFMFLLQFVWIITVTVLGQFWCSWHWQFWADRNKELHSFLGSPHVWVILSDQCHCFAEPAYCYDVQLLCHNWCKYWCCEDLKISACIYIPIIS